MFRAMKLLLQQPKHFVHLIRRHLSKKISSVKQPHSNVLKNSDVFRSLFDRCLLTTTFPDTLATNLDTFDRVPPIAYAGFDPTANSLHLGNLLVLNNLLHLYAAGFDVIVLIGGSTSKLGDPSGRTTERRQLQWDEIINNTEQLISQISNVFENYTKYIFQGDRSSLKPVRFVNNAKWYSQLNVIEFLDKYGRQFRTRHLLEKVAVRSRCASGEGSLTVNELLYQLFQAYDFFKLSEEFDCLLQLGGSDQIGNVHSGHDLIRKAAGKEAFGAFAPLLTNEKGEKLGKSIGDKIITLNPNVTTAFELYQYFLRLPDSVVLKYLYWFTFLPIDQAECIYQSHMKKPEERKGQKKLAEQATLLIHGESELESAIRSSEVLFSDKVQHLVDMSESEVNQTFKGVDSAEMILRPDITFFEVICSTKYFRDENHAMDAIVKGGVYVNSIRVRDPHSILVHGTHILPNLLTLLRFGKKNFFLIRWKMY